MSDDIFGQTRDSMHQALGGESGGIPEVRIIEATGPASRIASGSSDAEGPEETDISDSLDKSNDINGERLGNCEVIAHAPEGFVVTGGGYSLDDASGNVYRNQPTTDGKGWVVEAANCHGDITVFAVCVRGAMG